RYKVRAAASTSSRKNSAKMTPILCWTAAIGYPCGLAEAPPDSPVGAGVGGGGAGVALSPVAPSLAVGVPALDALVLGAVVLSEAVPEAVEEVASEVVDSVGAVAVEVVVAGVADSLDADVSLAVAVALPGDAFNAATARSTAAVSPPGPSAGRERSRPA